MNALLLLRRLLVAGLSVAVLTLVAGAGAAMASRMNTPGAFAPFAPAVVLLLGSLALALGCGRHSQMQEPCPPKLQRRRVKTEN